MLYKTYQKQVEAWKEVFPPKSDIKLNREKLHQAMLSSRHKDTIELIEAEIERKRGMRKKLIKNRMGDYYEDENWEGYNSAIDEDIAYLEENLQKIKKEL